MTKDDLERYEAEQTIIRRLKEAEERELDRKRRELYPWLKDDPFLPPSPRYNGIIN